MQTNTRFHHQSGIGVLLIVSWLLLAVFAVIIGYLVMNPGVVTKPSEQLPAVSAPNEQEWQPTIADDSTRVHPDTPAPIASYYEAVNRAAQSVVNIYTTQNAHRQLYSNDPVLQQFLERYYGGAPHQGVNLGSGVVVSSEGYIVTNAHVINGADEITVALNDGRKARATVIGSDADSDLAVIKVELDNLVPMAFRAEPIRVGDVSLAIGNPFGVGQTVTQGIISATGRTGIGVSSFEDFIQTDAAINPGNSGGALVDANGALIGINTAIYSRSGGSMGIGFAIPNQIVQQVMTSLITTGKVSRGWMGIEMVRMADDPTNIESRSNVIIRQVWQNSPAEHAGLKSGDKIVRIDGVQITSINELVGVVAHKAPGSQLTVDIMRDQRPMTVQVVLAERPSSDTLSQPIQNSPSQSRQSTQLEQLLQELESLHGTPQ
ncbi:MULTISPECIES: S1C family serine protease [Moraxella]|uniref:Outer membrane stress sensor protease DegS n=1 Tax=Moraxella catarrhalis TaxID=480 RepID=A0A7Z0V030_MORCA|nr:trypsin-like peptidase domain-containing protein [Moraxella catarrhalis]OAV01940.1 Outer membrane stress sensor protease DegS [Moraxella catarrhalis]STY82145.1 Serine endoprotease DegS precursor [Moraxella catarrhalis]